jgi:AcrR family transcriptional regulator
MQTDIPNSAAHSAPDRQPSERFRAKREQILQTAARKFKALGVRGATLEDIAIDVGMNLTSIRHYFRKNDDLVAAGFLRAIDVHLARIEVSKSAGDREARVRDFVGRYFEFRRRVRAGEEMDVMNFGDLRSLSEPHAGQVWPRYINLFRNVRGIVAEPSEIEDDRRRVNARAHLLISQLMRTIYWLPEYPDEELDQVEARFTDILLNGVAGPDAQDLHRLVELSEKAPPDKRSLESFLLAATRLINQQGYRGASVERIARQMNVTKGSFYHHIRAKDALVLACFNRNHAFLQEVMRLAAAQERRGLEQAFAAAAALVRRQQTPAGPLLRNSALTSVEPETRETMLLQMEQIVVRFTDMLSDGIVDGSARPCDARVGGQMLMAMVNAASELGAWVPDVAADESVSLFAAPMFKGLFAPA